jgi:nucleoside-diphosphate-sugar epimerase
MTDSNSIKKVLVTGGAGYVGAVLVPRLLKEGYAVRVLDLYIYGKEPLRAVRGDPRIEEVEGDLRDAELVRRCVAGCDAVIHLACISNDPSVELDPNLSRTINFEAFGPLVKMSKEAGVRRFIHASSGSVYGVSEDPNVTEEHPLVPVSLYNKYKALCEPVLLQEQSPGFTATVVRPATICGHSPRQRLDLTVNILTNHAVNAGKITVFGGKQMRPNLHMQDMIDLYLLLLRADPKVVGGQIFNAAYQNYSVSETARIVREVVLKDMPEKKDIEIVTTPSDDIRSYHISSEKIRRVLKFTPRYTIENAAKDLIAAFRKGALPNSMTDSMYFNIKRMKEIGLK